MLHWLLGQFIDTYRQIRTDVTIPHVFTGIVLYIIVHTAVKTGQKSAMRAESLFKNAVQQQIYTHVHSRHQGKASDCPDCATIVTIEDTVL